MFIFDQSVRLLGRNTVTVLVFHKVPLVTDPLVPDDPDLSAFIKILDMVMEQFTIVSLDDAVAHQLAGTLPRNAACLTFDDGYTDWSEGLVPVLLQRNAHATFFVTTGQLEGLPMWHERVIRAVRHSGSEGLNLSAMGMPFLPARTLLDKRNAILRLQEQLKYQAVIIRDAWLDLLEAMCRVNKSDVPVMRLSDLRDLHNKGFAIGSHTVNHPILNKATPSEVTDELVRSRDQIESVIGGKVKSFAYPNGRPTTDFNSDHVQMVKNAGYQFAVTTHHGVLREDTDPFLIPRFTPWGPGKFKMLSQTLRNQVY